MLVDDHPIVHIGVERVVEQVSDIEMSPGAHSGHEGAKLAAREHPHVVLLDLHLPDMALPQAAMAIRCARPGVKLVLFTGDNNPSVGQVAGLVGVDGVVHKENACDFLITAIREVMAGRRYCDPSIGDESTLMLPRREYQVLKQLARGESNAQIADYLGLAPNTVKSYVQSLLVHLGARNRLDAVVKAQQAGIL
ncbi:response regulator transcription factor [Mycobacterium paragordonae]|uniref:response regulator transcription factor n=1 Tax=Mycobacterium paragordonae TaxID=1389713 RepID=UPI0018CBF675|nr:response regulator transcription factor [Mycobacterium paragordonae]